MNGLIDMLVRRNSLVSIMLYFVAVVLIAGGLFDFFLPSMPSWHASYLGTTVAQVDARVEALDLAQMDAIGGSLFAIGVAVIFLVKGPLKRGEAGAELTILILVLVANGGNAFGMFQVGSPYIVPLILIGLTLLAIGIHRGQMRKGGLSGTRQVEF